MANGRVCVFVSRFPALFLNCAVNDTAVGGDWKTSRPMTSSFSLLFSFFSCVLLCSPSCCCSSLFFLFLLPPFLFRQWRRRRRRDYRVFTEFLPSFVTYIGVSGRQWWRWLVDDISEACFHCFSKWKCIFFSQNEVTFGDRWTVVHLFFYLFVDGDFR